VLASDEGPGTILEPLKELSALSLERAVFLSKLAADDCTRSSCRVSDCRASALEVTAALLLGRSLTLCFQRTSLDAGIFPTGFLWLIAVVVVDVSRLVCLGV
jgi:hypothetical protein